mmetsp:Transcript_22883/g.22158  ORF Transcript_22883/g.22158 Transcript_22883/m.22158 type:complete len:126 (+) Transcript_22883:1210-1587(+)
MRPSYTEEVIMHDNSFDNDQNYKELYEVPIQEESITTDYLSGKQNCSKGKLKQLKKELSGVLGEEEANEEKNLEMMISGGDYSPNSHTFFKHPFKNTTNPINGVVGNKEKSSGEYYFSKQTQKII